jgi:dTDP-4-amino-4,6-dideoxygalactose transaminase
MITVTKPFLPALEEYNKYLEKIWDLQWVTNNGPLVQQLEKELKEYLGVKHLLFVNNGTIALQIAIKALAPKGEIITTPFSYVATTNSILWEGCTPVFADIKNTDYNIDPNKIRPLINSNTKAILATHVYGNPCDVVEIEKIAAEFNLKVIYDAAHAFGTTYKSKSLLSYGDVSTCSFHATKLFHTIEGGAIITSDDALAEQMTLYRQFGHTGDQYFSVGINGKNSELHAAMGLCLLPVIAENMENRKASAALYDEHLSGLPLKRPIGLEGTEYNYSYYPVVFESEEKMLEVKSLLEKNGVGTRRYFYPSLNHLPQYNGEPCPVSESVSVRVLALPFYYRMDENDIAMICNCIKAAFV